MSKWVIVELHGVMTIIQKKDSVPIAELVETEDSDIIANANIIAASPDMLIMLNILAKCDIKVKSEKFTEKEIRTVLTKIIKRAKGER